MNNHLKRILTKCQKVLFLCFVCIPLSIISTFAIIYLILKCVYPIPVYEEYIPQMGIYIKLAWSGDLERVRLYISKNKKYADYVEFSNYDFPDFYYHPENGLYVIDQDSSCQIKIVRQEHSIKYINRKFYGKRKSKEIGFGLDTSPDSILIYGQKRSIESCNTFNTKLDSIQTARINQILGHPIFRIVCVGESSGFDILDDNKKPFYSSDIGFFDYDDVEYVIE